MQSWDRNLGEYVDTPKHIENFLRALEGLMQIYDVSIYHEDMEGAFIIKNGFEQDSSKRLKEGMLESFKEKKND